MSIKDEFHEAFDKFPEPPKDWNLSPDRWYALLGSKWMAERCANELYGQKIADGSDPGETIRQLSKELE